MNKIFGNFIILLVALVMSGATVFLYEFYDVRWRPLDFGEKLAHSAYKQLVKFDRYDEDSRLNVVLKSYEDQGIDLVSKIQSRMNTQNYPKLIDLVAFLRSAPDAIVKLSTLPENYRPGDIVTWNLDDGSMHVGVVSNRKSWITSNPIVIHHRSSYGPLFGDDLFDWELTGHYRYGE